MTHWEELIVAYADGQTICNCGQAYAAPCATGIDAQGRWRNDLMACRSGCSANQLDAKEYIAKRVMSDLGRRLGFSNQGTANHEETAADRSRSGFQSG